MARADKAATVAEITEEFRASNATVLTEYRGLSVGQLKNLRRALGSDTTYAVVKNTLTKIAAKDAGIEGFDELLAGPTAIAFVQGDPVAAAKAIDTFAAANPALVIKGGMMDGKVLSADEIKKLAKLESREVLLSKVAGAANAALAKAAALFQAPLSQAARTIEALRVAGGAAGAPVAEAPAAAAPADEAPAAETADEAVATDETSEVAEAAVEETAAEAAEETTEG